MLRPHETVQALVGHESDEAYAVGALYERAGFEVVSKEFDLPKIGSHVRMERRISR